jgi:hypothetical protein
MLAASVTWPTLPASAIVGGSALLDGCRNVEFATPAARGNRQAVAHLTADIEQWIDQYVRLFVRCSGGERSRIRIASNPSSLIQFRRFAPARAGGVADVDFTLGSRHVLRQAEEC